MGICWCCRDDRLDGVIFPGEAVGFAVTTCNPESSDSDTDWSPNNFLFDLMDLDSDGKLIE
jgi:hypothetical protein